MKQALTVGGMGGAIGAGHVAHADVKITVRGFEAHDSPVGRQEEAEHDHEHRHRDLGDAPGIVIGDRANVHAEVEPRQMAEGGKERDCGQDKGGEREGAQSKPLKNGLDELQERSQLIRHGIPPRIPNRPPL